MMRLILFFLICLFSSSAHAVIWHQTKSQALAACHADLSNAAAVCQSSTSGYQYVGSSRCVDKSPSLSYYEAEAGCGRDGQFHQWLTINHHGWRNNDLGDCSSRPSMGATSMNVDSSGRACVDGCYFEMSSMGAYGYNQDLGVFRGTANQWSPSGATCSVGNINPDILNHTPEPNEYCSDIGSKGSKSCVKSNGEHCIKFSSGGQHCWNPEFRGTEIVKDGNTWVSRKKSPDKPQPPPEAEKPTTEGTSTVVIGNQIYNVAHGATGGIKEGVGNGNSSGGNGNGNGNGNGDGDGTSAGGGSNCGDPPTCSGDAATCAVYRQVWLQRCDGHGQFDGNDGGDFGLPGDIDAALNDDGDDSWRSGESDVLKDKEINGDALLSKLDSSGFLGGGTCPPPVNISIGGKATMKFSFAAICEMLASASYLVMMLAYYLAIRIITKTK